MQNYLESSLDDVWRLEVHEGLMTKEAEAGLIYHLF
jgi:hypothetical protein